MAGTIRNFRRKSFYPGQTPMNPIRKKSDFFPFGRLVVLGALIVLAVFSGCRSMPQPKPYEAPHDAAAHSGRPYVFYTAGEMAEAIRQGQISSQELVRIHLSHIYLHNPKLNAIVILDEQGALNRASEADKAIERGEIWGPLHGVPITLKDHFAVRNMRTTNAHPDMSEQLTLFDATVASRLQAAGAVILGKTNMPYVAMDLQTDNVIFGRTNNPWDLNRTPGGSTGGGAAAVAAGLTPIDIGSDMGGSLRLPAHFTGVYSLKPTENAVSGYGSFPGLLSPDERGVRYMASIGPVARSVADLKLAFEIIAGPDGKDSLVIPVQPLAEDNKPAPEALRIAWSNNLGNVPISEETRDVFNQALRELSGAGIHVDRVNPNINFEEAWKTWGEMMDIQVMSNQPGPFRFFFYWLGWSYRAQTPLLQMVYPLSTQKYIRVLSKRDHFVAGFDRFMSEWDVFICPVAAIPAIEHYPPDAVRRNLPMYIRPIAVNGHKLNYYTAMSAYTVPFNLTGHPVVTLPAGFTTDGLPIGLQIVGKRWDDMRLLAIAQIIDDIINAYQEPEGY